MKNDEAHRNDITIGEEATEQFVRPGLVSGHTAPDFRLQSSDGGVVSPTDYKEKNNIVIIFFNPVDSSDLEIVAELKRRYPEFVEENAEVLGVASGPIGVFSECAKALQLPFPLLADVMDETKNAYHVIGPTIFVADRYGELKMQNVIAGNLDAVLDEVISTLELIEIECPECGVSTWPVE